MTDTMTQNNKFELGKSFLEKYLNDNEEMIKTVAKTVTSGIDLLVVTNNIWLRGHFLYFYFFLLGRPAFSGKDMEPV